MTPTAPITRPTKTSANSDQRGDGENSHRHALRKRPGGCVSAIARLPAYLLASTFCTTALMSASLAAIFLWSSGPPVFSISTSFASAPALPWYFLATSAHDGPFLVVVAVWQLWHLPFSIRSSAESARAWPAKPAMA